MPHTRFGAALLLCRVALAAVGVAFPFHAGVWAGGVTFDDPDQDENAGPPFSGIVRDRGGSPIGDAKITVTVKIFNSSLILRSDADGHFTVNGFDKSVSPSDVDIACSKDGYTQFAEARRPWNGNVKTPIQVTCVLQKQ